MPSPDEILADIEADRTSREAEIRLIENLISTAGNDDDRGRLRRMLVLVVYSHLEGFCKFALLSYSTAINSLGIECRDAAAPIAAAGLTQVFRALRDSQSKHPVFRKPFPHDADLHLSHREQEFIAEYEAISSIRVNIPDTAIDTRSNLDTDVLKMLLFRLGLDYNNVETHRSSLNRLVGNRNAIAHGDRLKIPTENAVSDYLATARTLMSFLQSQIYNALVERIFLRHPASSLADSGQTTTSVSGN
jgi:hypothetical protein